MNSPFAIDLQLTTLEFQGLVNALRRYTVNVGNQSACLLAEDEMILARYAASLTSARLLMWKKRYQRELKCNLSALDRPRYSYQSDWLLARVLFRLLSSDWDIDPASRALLARLRQIQINATAATALSRIGLSTTGAQVGIVDTYR